MKSIIKSILCMLVVTNIAASCYGQKMMRITDDAHKLKANEHQFIGKPLSNLLKEIGPEIKMVTADGERADGLPGYFIIRFVNKKQYDSLQSKGKKPLQITVFVKEHFKWDIIQTRTKGHEFEWTKGDKEKYGNLTVVGLRIYGQP